MTQRKRTLFAAAVVIVLLLTAVVVARAQEVTTISVQVSGFAEDIFRDQVIPAFQAQNPDIEVVLISEGGGFNVRIGGFTQDVEELLDTAESLVTAADVVAISPGDITPETTRAGYFLDLNPLAASDPTLDIADFYPAIWESYRWDSGLWALPVSADMGVLWYDPAAFDAAGLAYPSANWTIADMENAIRALTQFDADGAVEVPGFATAGGDLGTLFLALAGTDVVDDRVFPAVPDYSDPTLQAVLETWAQLLRDGYFAGGIGLASGAPLILGNALFSPGGVTVGGGQRGNQGEAAYVPVVLPGGRGAVDVSGFAVSAGTQNPDAAYRLAAYLTQSPEAASVLFGVTPARQSLAGVSADTGGFRFETAPEVEALVVEALPNAMGAAERRFSEHLQTAVTDAVQNGVDIVTALETVELAVLDRLAVAEARAAEGPVIVARPETPDLAPGEIALRFGVGTFATPLPNQGDWEALLAEFAADHPTVGHVALDVDFPTSLDEMTSAYDCFITNSNQVPNADLSLLRSIDPLIATDPGIGPETLAGNALAQVQREGLTWAVPISIQPLLMRYDAELFAQAGAFPPEGGTWNVDEFEMALRALGSPKPGDTAPFQPQSLGNGHILSLIAAYGGLPFDFRTDPVTVNFTDAATVEAIRQVLDLARNGLMAYEPLAPTGGNVFVFAGGGSDAPLYTQFALLSGLSGLDAIQDAPVLFPQGSQYNAISYDITAGYISADSPHAEACYSLLSEIAQTPALIDAMPAVRVLLDSPQIAATQGEDALALYRELDALMQQPNTIIVPSLSVGSGGGASALIQNQWINRVFDAYVAEEIVDLEAELAEAEQFTREYMACAATIPPFDPTIQEPSAYFQQFAACALQVDPSLTLGG